MESEMIAKGLNPALTPLTSMMAHLSVRADQQDDESTKDEPPDWVKEGNDART